MALQSTQCGSPFFLVSKHHNHTPKVSSFRFLFFSFPTPSTPKPRPHDTMSDTSSPHRQSSDPPTDGLHLTAPYEDFLDQAFLRFWPAVQGPDEGPENADQNLSGVACAILVLRTVLSFLEDARAPVVDQFPPGTIKILDLALGRADNAAIKAFCEEWGPPPPSFEDLVENVEMWRSLWCIRYFILKRLMVSDHAESPLEEDVVEQKWVDWDGNSSLPAHLDTLFGPVREDRKSHETEIIERGHPMILRVRLKISNKDAPAAKLNFDGDVKRFEYAGAVYRCVAIVRLRDSPAGQDTLRLYYPGGGPFWPSGGAYPLSDGWQVPDPGRYMVYYLRTNMPIAPEEPVYSGLKGNPFADSRRRFGKIFLDEVKSVPEAPPASTKRPLPDPRPPPPRQVLPPRPSQANLQGQSSDTLGRRDSDAQGSRSGGPLPPTGPRGAGNGSRSGGPLPPTGPRGAGNGSRSNRPLPPTGPRGAGDGSRIDAGRPGPQHGAGRGNVVAPRGRQVGLPPGYGGQGRGLQGGIRDGEQRQH
jgi:hypothetical protein